MNDMEKLSLLLSHWVEHNAEHASEFRAWADQARAAGKEHVAARIESAAGKMIAANADLAEAIDGLQKGG